ncbi:hypothetical protein LB452_06100 [Psychroflexus sp. CAK8W]|uniref:Uncharacterized protein n=1 Tax=Psychroflexus longus TaxID=2873596 RepID=A0ABS7XHQ8_9FLAO|nr:hypothetical protein [Psychroflexus longus]MBZ9778492.1 hypothetical protein [Psychroflexus longus]
MKNKSVLCKVSVLIFFAVAVSCNNQNKDDKDDKIDSETSDELQEKIKLDTIQLVKLSDETKRATEDWNKYIALNSEIERFENYTLLDVINNASAIGNVVDSLNFTVPRVFDTKAVKARIVTIQTHTLLLGENSKRVEPNPSQIKDLSAKIKLDFNNLNIQLNEVFIIEDNSFQID